VCATVETQSGVAATGNVRKTHPAMFLLPARYHPLSRASCFVSLFPFLSVTVFLLATTLHPISLAGLAHHLLVCFLPACRFSPAPCPSCLRDERNCAPPLSAVAVAALPMLFRAMSTCAQHNTSVVALSPRCPPILVVGGKVWWAGRAGCVLERQRARKGPSPAACSGTCGGFEARLRSLRSQFSYNQPVIVAIPSPAV